jgi:hypothetical protein
MTDSSDDDNLSTISDAKTSGRGSSPSTCPSPASSSPSTPRSKEASLSSRESKAPETAADATGNEEKHVDVNVGKAAGRVAFLSSKEEEEEEGSTRFSNHRQMQYEENDSEGESDEDLEDLVTELKERRSRMDSINTQLQNRSKGHKSSLKDLVGLVSTIGAVDIFDEVNEYNVLSDAKIVYLSNDIYREGHVIVNKIVKHFKTPHRMLKYLGKMLRFITSHTDCFQKLPERIMLETVLTAMLAYPNSFEIQIRCTRVVSLLMPFHFSRRSTGGTLIPASVFDDCTKPLEIQSIHIESIIQSMNKWSARKSLIKPSLRVLFTLIEEGYGAMTSTAFMKGNGSDVILRAIHVVSLSHSTGI